MLNQLKAGEHGSVSRYRRNSLPIRAVVGVMVFTSMVLVPGCAGLETGGRGDEPPVPEERPAAKASPVEEYLAFMKRASTARGPDRQRIFDELDQRGEESPLSARLQRGFLLTSPTETRSRTAEGENILREILAGHADLHPAVRDLVEVRLQEVEVRQALRVELGEAKGKIEDLLNIESSMEQKKSESESESRTR